MIKLTKLNGKAFILNSDLIEFIEQTPDTIISTTTGKKIVVVESVEEVVEKVLQYKRKIFLFKDLFINQDR
ncbi:flagellar FlbD family protein [Acetivibrio straminisolvens]|jgi:flagellar protein FlbD|uniref:Flagellar protein FlbD n=1 Tax=Acetivibrio straminisolvens JCM 21531 TaxID=1294263 RepID=W4V842_9FIRM|nr:flagellar FlbD family protein [Acetivibrio straminisolvens]GAE88973.1 flagellar protein FlbD [Acetivibrio straminisolvens JCM 21531]